MKVLLDECLPRRLKYALPEWECQTVPEAGLAGKKNGVLLSLAEDGGFEVFLTMDKGVEYEQNLTGRKIAVIIFRARSNRLVDLMPLVPSCIVSMRAIEPGRLVRIEG
jgi:predicted nuclease of predicted toxin-antitoxin system